MELFVVAFSLHPVYACLKRGAWVLCKLYQRTVVVFAPCVGLSVFVLRAAMKEVCGFAALYGPKDYKMLWHQG